jgi:hypothetical protein
MKKIRIVISIALLLVATLIHGHYIDYGAAPEGHLIVLSTASQTSALHVRDELKKPLIEATWRDILEMNGEAVNWDHAAKGAVNAAIASTDMENAKTPEERDAAKSALDIAENNMFPESEARARELRNMMLRSLDNKVVYFGMLPSNQIGGSPRLQRRDAFWVGIILPLTLVALAILCMLIPLGRRIELPQEPKPLTPTLATPHLEPTQNSPPMASLADLLREDIDASFPVSGGNGKRDDPLIVTEERDYVGVEYAVVRYVLGSIKENYKLAEQKLLTINDRAIDELVFHVKSNDEELWAGTRRFYFDITAGFNRGVNG